MNQDSFLVNNAKGLYAIADGVGGGLSGEVASQMAVAGLDELGSALAADAPLTPVVHQLQKRVYGHAIKEYGEPVMGTTLTAARMTEGNLTVCHAGDSRCYHYTGGALQLLTEDHEIFDHRVQGSVLSSYLGLPEDLHALTVLEKTVPVAAGDRILICSDGLYRQLLPERIIELIEAHRTTAPTLVAQLCEEASRKEHSDNVTVVIIEIENT